MLKEAAQLTSNRQLKCATKLAIARSNERERYSALVIKQNSMAKVVEGDLLQAKVDVIVQQCNCVTLVAHGLSAAIEKRYPYANVYAKRTPQDWSLNTATHDTRGKLGSVTLCRPPNTADGPIVACLMAQLCPGLPEAWAFCYKVEPDSDSRSARAHYFRKALDELTAMSKTEKWTTIGFPCGIGCGLAGGNWDFYKVLIDEFANKVKEQGVSVIIYKRTSS